MIIHVGSTRVRIHQISAFNYAADGYNEETGMRYSQIYNTYHYGDSLDHFIQTIIKELT